MDSCKGVPKPNWCFPSFILPLEILAFEAIPKLKMEFREEVVGASKACPRMCKTKFKYSSMTGFSIGEINSGLGETQDIVSIMEPELDELPLLRENTEVDSFDCCDPIVDGWTQLLGKGKKIFFEELFKNDVEGRDEKKYIQEKEKEKGKGRGRRKGKGKGKEKAKDNYGELKDIVEAGFKNMGEIMARMDVSLNGKLESLGKRVGEVENFVGYNDFVGHAEEEDEEEAERQEEEALRKQQEEEEAALRKQQEEEEEALRKQKEEEEEALRKQREEEEEAVRKQREQEEEALRKQQEEEEEGGGSTEDVEVEEVVVKAVKKRARGSYKPPVTRASKKQKK